MNKVIISESMCISLTIFFYRVKFNEIQVILEALLIKSIEARHLAQFELKLVIKHSFIVNSEPNYCILN